MKKYKIPFLSWLYPSKKAVIPYEIGQEPQIIKPKPMEDIKFLDKTGIAFLAQNEGEILHPYKDSVGIPTIGIGCTYYENGTRVKMTDPPITRERSRLFSFFSTAL